MEAPVQVLDVDWADLELAFRDATGAENYLDRDSGEIMTVIAGFSDEEELKESLSKHPERFLRIPSIDAAHGRAVMANFIGTLPPSSMKVKLTKTSTGAGALTRALTLLREDDALLQRYYRFEQASFWRHVESFLAASSISPASPAPAPELFEDRALR